MSLALDLAKIVLVVQKTLKSTQFFFILNNFFSTSLPKKSYGWGFLALSPLLAVGPGPDGPGCLDMFETN